MQDLTAWPYKFESFGESHGTVWRHKPANVSELSWADAVAWYNPAYSRGSWIGPTSHSIYSSKFRDNLGDMNVDN